MAVRIICIKKDEGNFENPYVAIDHFEWVNERINVKGVTDRTKIYDWIKNEDGEAYVIDQKGNKVRLVPAIGPNGDKYVKTADDAKADTLLSLPLCD